MSSFQLRKDRLSVSNHKLTQKSSSPTEVTKKIRGEKPAINDGEKK
jgi:hypothetical protein